MNAIAFDIIGAEPRAGGECGTIRSVARALNLLALINTRYCLSLHDLHRLSGLPKPTVYRILATLHAEGYVELEGRHGIYRVAAKVRELSAGYSDQTMVIDIGRPILLAATRRIKWPLALGQLDNLQMAVRFSTMPNSPMAVKPTTLGQRHALARSGMGIAYLAFCPDAERERLLDLALEDAGASADRDRLMRRIEAARRRGYGLRLAEKSGDSATAALPIRRQGQVVAALSLTTFGSVMNEAFVAGLRETLDGVVADIESAYAARLEDGVEPAASPRVA